MVIAFLCAEIGGAYQGDNTLCPDVTCPPPIGVCCLNGICQVITQNDCDEQGGAYQGNFTTCADTFCPPPPGACCLPNGDCVASTQLGCAELNGSRLRSL